MSDGSRYTRMPIEDRPLHELYGLDEALEDFIDAATDPLCHSFRELLASTDEAGQAVLVNDPSFRDGKEAAEEFVEAKQVILEVVIPTNIFTTEEKQIMLRTGFHPREPLLVQAMYLFQGRVQTRIAELEKGA